MALCKVMIIGNLGSDPEMRYTPNNRAVTQFNVAVNQSTKNQQTGEWVEETDWFRVSVWGDRAERMAESCARATRSSWRVGSRPASSKAVTARRAPRSRSLRTRSSTSSAARAMTTVPSTPSRRGRLDVGRRWRRRRRSGGGCATSAPRPTTPISTTFPSDQGVPDPCLPLVRASATTSIAIDAAARCARSAPTRPPSSTTRRSTASVDTFGASQDRAAPEDRYVCRASARAGRRAQARSPRRAPPVRPAAPAPLT